MEFSSNTVFPWKSQIDPCALPSTHLSSSALHLQSGFLFSFFSCVTQSCINPLSQVRTLSCLFILSPFHHFDGSSSQTHLPLSSLPQSLPHQGFKFRVVFFTFILFFLSLILLLHSEIQQWWKRNSSSIFSTSGCSRCCPMEPLPHTKRDHTRQRCANLLRWKLPPSKVSTAKFRKKNQNQTLNWAL